jgi:hypothetical protein
MTVRRMKRDSRNSERGNTERIPAIRRFMPAILTPCAPDPSSVCGHGEVGGFAPAGRAFARALGGATGARIGLAAVNLESAPAVIVSARAAVGFAHAAVIFARAMVRIPRATLGFACATVVSARAAVAGARSYPDAHVVRVAVARRASAAAAGVLPGPALWAARWCGGGGGNGLSGSAGRR